MTMVRRCIAVATAYDFSPSTISLELGGVQPGSVLSITGRALTTTDLLVLEPGGGPCSTPPAVNSVGLLVVGAPSGVAGARVLTAAVPSNTSIDYTRYLPGLFTVCGLYTGQTVYAAVNVAVQVAAGASGHDEAMRFHSSCGHGPVLTRAQTTKNTKPQFPNRWLCRQPSSTLTALGRC